MRFETIAIHAGERPDRAFGAISTPIYQTSAFVFEDVDKTRGYDYSRTANPTFKPSSGPNPANSAIFSAAEWIKSTSLISLGMTSLMEVAAALASCIFLLFFSFPGDRARSLPTAKKDSGGPGRSQRGPPGGPPARSRPKLPARPGSGR